MGVLTSMRVTNLPLDLLSSELYIIAFFVDTCNWEFCRGSVGEVKTTVISLIHAPIFIHCLYTSRTASVSTDTKITLIRMGLLSQQTGR